MPKLPPTLNPLASPPVYRHCGVCYVCSLYQDSETIARIYFNYIKMSINIIYLVKYNYILMYLSSSYAETADYYIEWPKLQKLRGPPWRYVMKCGTKSKNNIRIL